MTENSRIALVTDPAAAGLTVLLASRNLDRGKAAAQTIAGDVPPLQLDITGRDLDRRCRRAGRARYLGRLDILVNNAVISAPTARGKRSRIISSARGRR
ncbi:MAG: SDR family NAD(P)-dependent oxidoreductase [Candidatus Devosia euplotis]|nr:SDR family NAD(P)-dependent oxidoreductase [Candidatus Devosia euplotis]